MEPTLVFTTVFLHPRQPRIALVSNKLQHNSIATPSSKELVWFPPEAPAHRVSDPGLGASAVLGSSAAAAWQSPGLQQQSMVELLIPYERLFSTFSLHIVPTRSRVVRHPALAVPHLSVAHIGHLDFEGLKAMGCKGIIFDKVNNEGPSSESLWHGKD